MENEFMKTCLYDSHLALGAKMSPFAGFMMPIQYSSIRDEHLAVRNHVGMFDVSHMGEILISGSDAEAFTDHIFTNEVKGAGAGKILYGMMLYPDGGVVDDLLVYCGFVPDVFLLVVNAANIGKDYEWIKKQAGSYNVIIDNQSDKWGQIAVQGPDSEKIVTEVLGLDRAVSTVFYTYFETECDGTGIIVSRTGYTGEDGFEIYASVEKTVSIWNELLKAGVTPCGLGCRDTLRFEAGLPLYGDELSAQISPVMAGLGMFCKLDKEEFIGKDALKEQKASGVSKKLVGIELEDKAVPRATYPVETEDGRQVGVVTTGYHSISLDKSICFALVESGYSVLGTKLNVRIRKKVFSGTVVKKRFYRTNYKK
ncbi:MAG: glycine cleavage system aminomethyltransferase GcvT [Bacteroidales bacterium]|jgi:aminomethyltransferase|nr:glycine cleavage system aminomethyltransferase GcvT [Bacteroidales bacterium]